MNEKADMSTMTSLLAAKADSSDMTMMLAEKADVSTVSSLSSTIEAKADINTMTSLLAVKAQLCPAAKADSSDMTTLLAKKADVSTVSSLSSTVEANADMSTMTSFLESVYDHLTALEEQPSAQHEVIPGAETLGRAFRLDSGILGPQILDESFLRAETFDYAFDAESVVYSLPDFINMCTEWTEAGQITSTSTFKSFSSWVQHKATRFGISTSFFGLFKSGASHQANFVRQTLAETGTYMYEWIREWIHL